MRSLNYATPAKKLLKLNLGVNLVMKKLEGRVIPL